MMKQSLITIKLAQLHTMQRRITQHAARYQVVCTGRRSGKTTLAVDILANAAIEGESWGYFAPTYGMLSPVWRTLKKTLAGVTASKNETERRLTLVTGGSIECWSLDNADRVRGRKYHGLIIDEAAQVPDLLDGWQNAISPLLTDYRGRAYFFSTPNGFNGFWHLYNRGIDPLYPEWQAWQYPTSANPHIDPAEIEAQRNELPERAFRQEYLAEFMTDSGGVFRSVTDVSTLAPSAPTEGGQYVFGVDWGRSNDFTAISVIDASTGEQVAIDRFTQIGWAVQQARIIAMYRHWKPVSIIAEENSFGDVNIEALLKEGLPIRRFSTTAQTKTPLIDALAVAIEKGNIRLLNDRVQMAELQAYEMQRLPSGAYRYTAPSGGHDDTVMALALAWYGVRNNLNKLRVMQW
jgi:hypothetical protein